MVVLLILIKISFDIGNTVTGGYTFSRIDKLLDISSFNLTSLYYYVISVDNSLLVRIGYPVVAFNMFMDHPFGLGVGGFAYNLKDYFFLLNVPTVYSSEVISHLQQNNADPRNLFLQVAVDFGVFGVFLLLYFLYRAVVILVKYDNSRALNVKLYFCLSLGIMMQFSTIYMSLYPLVFSLLLYVKYET